jgi:hypothetical protein
LQHSCGLRGFNFGFERLRSIKVTYKDMAFCPAQDCRNLDCKRNTNRPDFKPEGMAVCYANFSENCKEYKKEQSK